MQQELFDLPEDYRVERLRIHIGATFIRRRLWNPSAKEILAMGEEYKVIGSKPLKIVEEERAKYLKNMEESCEDHDDYYIYDMIAQCYNKSLKKRD